MTGACAALVARDDPPLHATALFAPGRVRGALMVLYALDVELSRAARASTEALIPRMRLQWWRDVVAEAATGAPAKAHEVAGPLAALVRDGLPADLLDALIDGYEAGLDPPGDMAGWQVWAAERFGARTALAVHLLGGAPLAPDDAAAFGTVLGAGFALRTALPLLGEGRRSFLPSVAPSDQFALVAGTPAGGAVDEVRRFAQAALDRLTRLRAGRRQFGRAAVPAFLPLAREERVLRQVARDPAALAEGRIAPDPPFAGLRLAGRALTGRW